MKPKTKSANQRLAERIARDLFTDQNGLIGNYLILIVGDSPEKSLYEATLATRITAHLDRADKRKGGRRG